MTAHDVSSCIAMDEDGDWYAFPKTIPRAALMPILAESYDGDWWDTIHVWKIRAAWMRPVPAPDGTGQPWHEICERDDPDAIPVWMCRSW